MFSILHDRASHRLLPEAHEELSRGFSSIVSKARDKNDPILVSTVTGRSVEAAVGAS